MQLAKRVGVDVRVGWIVAGRVGSGGRENHRPSLRKFVGDILAACHLEYLHAALVVDLL